MARHLSLSCDACAKKEGPKVTILPSVTRREDGVRLTADLCTACWQKLQKEYGFSEHTKPNRKTFQVFEDTSEILS